MAKDIQKISIYIKILNYIEEQNKRSYFPKTSDIIEFLKKSNIIMSDRTLNRYLNAISLEFDVNIEKTNHQGGYFINKENSIYFEDIFQTLQLVDKALYFKSLINKSSKVLQYFSFSGENFSGFEWIDTILRAIEQKSIILIKHKRFNTDTTTERQIEPYLLKEYLYRWYLVGYDKLNKENRSFGLDRIIDITILEKKFKNIKTNEVKEEFSNTIGLIYSKPEFIQLSFNKELKAYFKTNPWHDDYKIIEENENELIVELFISINYELIQRILMHTKNITVISPQSLRSTIVRLMKESLALYN